MKGDIWKEIKWMLTFVKGYRWKIVILVIIGVFGSISSVVATFLSKYILDFVTRQSNWESINIVFVGVLTGALVVTGLVVNAFTTIFSTKISIRVSNELRANFFSKIMRADWQKITSYHSGNLLTRMTSDIGVLSSFVMSFAPQIIALSVQVVVAFCVVMYFDITLALIALLGGPIIALTVRFLGRKIREFNLEMQAVHAEAQSFTQESISNLTLLKAWDILYRTVKRLGKIQQKLYDVSMKRVRFSTKTQIIISTLTTAIAYAGLGWGAYQLWIGAITFGTMAAFLQLVSKIQQPVMSLAGMIPTGIAATASARRLIEIYDMEDENPDRVLAEDTQSQNMDEPYDLRFEGASFAYNDAESVLEDCTFDVKAGEKAVFLGPSGEGKTTLIRLLLALIKPTSGQITVNDEIISPATRYRFSYVPQGNSVFSGTIAENLRLVCPNATDDEIVAVLKSACAWEFVEKLPDGIDTLVGEKGTGLSEGQSQRIAIARAILQNTPIMILDEATSALDLDTEKNVIDGIMGTGKGKTLIITTHRPSIIPFCDKVFKIEEKRVVSMKKES